MHDNWELFKNKCDMLVEKFIPKLSFRASSQKPWFTKTLKRLENKKKRLFRSARQHNNENAWLKYYAAEKAYLTAIPNAQ